MTATLLYLINEDHENPFVKKHQCDATRKRFIEISCDVSIISHVIKFSRKSVTKSPSPRQDLYNAAID